jgi:AraC-like DNA-binding protein
MMLRYVGLGERRLGDHPMPPHPRLNWEFLAVVQGKLAPFEKMAKSAKPEANRLWLFPPGVVHGWVGERGKTCEILALHFSSLPRAVEEICQKHSVLQTRLSEADRRALAEMVPILQNHYWNPTVESEIQTQRALMGLCLLILRDYDERSSRQLSGGSYNRVVTAEEWLRRHLPDNPTIHAAARHVALSSTQLCRLFLQIRKETPQDYLNRIKIDRAMELLGHTDAKLEKIAAECGFSSASNLCRAFKSAKGMSPTRWRTEMYIQYKSPRPEAAADHKQHGERVRPVL